MGTNGESERASDGDALDGSGELGHLSGYDDSDQYLATRFQQGGRDVYCIDLSVPQLVALLPKPDPERQLDGNRKINRPHANAFATYIRENEQWVIPPLLLRASKGAFDFVPRKNFRGTETEWGVLTLPRLARNDLKIVDGQHRILGFHLALEDIDEELDSAKGKLATIKRRGGAADKRREQRQVSKITLDRQRLAHDRVSVQIVIVDADEEYKQMFVDIAKNAKGISKSVTTRFDTRFIVNRCIDAMIDHPLLKERVDPERDRVVGRNENLMGAKHVADIVRTIQVGISGRITKKREVELTETKLIDDARLFLDTLVEGFADFLAVQDGVLTVPELRARSLLASTSMQRVLAGVYHNLLINPLSNTVWPPRDENEPGRIRVARQRSRSEVVRFFESLAPHMSAPTREDSVWVTDTNQFGVGDSGPGARAQEVKELTTKICQWAVSPPEWLKTEGKP